MAELAYDATNFLIPSSGACLPAGFLVVEQIKLLQVWKRHKTIIVA